MLLLVLGGCVPGPNSTGPTSNNQVSANPNQLSLTGAMTAQSARLESCGYRDAPPRLLFGSEPMPVGAAGEVVRISWTLDLTNAQVGTYSAVAPLGEYNRPPVQIAKARSAAAGAANGLWLATGGTVTITATDHLGQSGSSATVSGTVNATARGLDGTLVRVSGAWRCVIEPTANG